MVLPDLPPLPDLAPSDRAAPVAECGEPLVAVDGVRCVDSLKRRGVPGHCEQLLLRASAARALRTADLALPAGLSLVVLDAYRTLESQRWMFEAAYASGDLPPGFVADPDSTVLPPHCTGAAVDVTLSFEGDLLPLGTAPGSYEPLSNLSALERVDPEGPANRLRRVLYWTLHQAGFVGIREEWWHFSLGDQEWAVQAGAPAARYGVVEVP